MLEPSSSLTASCAILKFLEFAGSFIDKAYNLSQSANDLPQEPTEIEREAETLKDVEGSHSAGQSKAEAKLTEPEKGIQSVYERCRALADKLVSVLRTVNSEDNGMAAKGTKIVEGRKSDADKHRKELDTLRSECVIQLQRLLCKSLVRLQNANQGRHQAID